MLNANQASSNIFAINPKSDIPKCELKLPDVTIIFFIWNQLDTLKFFFIQKEKIKTINFKTHLTNYNNKNSTESYILHNLVIPAADTGHQEILSTQLNNTGTT